MEIHPKDSWRHDLPRKEVHKHMCQVNEEDPRQPYLRQRPSRKAHYVDGMYEILEGGQITLLKSLSH